MFIGQDGWKTVPRSVGAKHWVSERHISLLRSESVLFGDLSINISPLCGEGTIYVYDFRVRTLVCVVLSSLKPTLIKVSEGKPSNAIFERSING